MSKVKQCENPDCDQPAVKKFCSRDCENQFRFMDAHYLLDTQYLTTVEEIYAEAKKLRLARPQPPEEQNPVEIKVIGFLEFKAARNDHLN